MKSTGGQLGGLADGQSTPELERLFEEGRSRVFQPGENLITEGQSADYLYDMVRGSVLLARNGCNGRRQILAFIGPGQLLGIGSTPRYPNQATALTEVEAIIYPRTSLEKALDSTPKFASNFRLVISRILESAHDHVFTIGQRSAIERLASFLLYLRTNQARFSVGGPRPKDTFVDLPMTRLDIADFLGLTIETVSRAFASLKKRGAISFENSHSCEILDLDMIRSLGGRDDFTVIRGSN